MAAELAGRPYCKRWRNPQSKTLRKVYQEGKFSKGSMKQVIGYGLWVIGKAFTAGNISPIVEK